MKCSKIKICFFIVVLIIGIVIMLKLEIIATLLSMIKNEDFKCYDCNVILISIDSLRADHLGTYGYFRDTSPNIDKLAENGIIFENAIAQAPYTEASHMSILTSLYPSTHQVLDTESILNESKITLTEIIKRNGYSTAAFVDLYGFQGFDRGFDTYIISNLSSYKPLSIKEEYDYVIDWLIKNNNKKFFIFLHVMDVHHPYEPPLPFDDMYKQNYNGNLNGVNIDLLKKIRNKDIIINNEDYQYIISQYDGEITYVDKYVGLMIDKLKELNLSNNTIIIITSDHGEEFMEHGAMGWHGLTLYNEVLRVPLIIKQPTLSKQYKRDNVVRSIDIMPTTLDILGIDFNEKIQGVSLLPLLRGKDNRLFAFSSTKNLNLISIRTDSHTFIYNLDTGEEELYNLKKDPLEKNNIINKEPKVGIAMKKILFELMEENKRLSSESEKIIINEEMLEKLKSLGYI